MKLNELRRGAAEAIGLRVAGPDKDGFYEATLGIGTGGVRGISRNVNAAIAYTFENAAAVYLAAAKAEKDAGDPPESA